MSLSSCTSWPWRRCYCVWHSQGSRSTRVRKRRLPWRSSKPRGGGSPSRHRSSLTTWRKTEERRGCCTLVGHSVMYLNMLGDWWCDNTIHLTVPWLLTRAPGHFIQLQSGFLIISYETDVTVGGSIKGLFWSSWCWSLTWAFSSLQEILSFSKMRGGWRAFLSCPALKCYTWICSFIRIIQWFSVKVFICICNGHLDWCHFIILNSFTCRNAVSPLFPSVTMPPFYTALIHR